MFSISAYYITTIFLHIKHTRVNVYKPTGQKQTSTLSYTLCNKSVRNSAYHFRVDGRFDQRTENASKSTGALVLVRN